MKDLNRKLAALKQALIPPILLVVLPTAAIGFLASGSKDWIFLFAALVVAALVDVSANVINNYADWDIDAANRKRARIREVFEKKHLLALYALILSALFVSLFFMRANVFLYASVFCFILLGIAYSAFLKLKDAFPLNYAAIAVSYGGLAFCIGFFSGTASVQGFFSWLPIVVFLVLVDFGYSMTKDYADVFGDAAFRKRTLPVLLGKKKAVQVQAVVITAAYSFLLFTVLAGGLHPLFLLLFVSYALALYKLRVIHATEDKKTHDLMHFYSQVNGLIVRLLIICVVIALAS